MTDTLPEDERMTPAELRVITEWLGLRQRDVAGMLGVDERTVRNWLAGRYLIPDGVRLEIEQIEDTTARAVGEVVDALKDASDVGVIVYRTDEDMWADRPDSAPLSASWWRMVAARAMHEVPGVEVTYWERPWDGVGGCEVTHAPPAYEESPRPPRERGPGRFACSTSEAGQVIGCQCGEATPTGRRGGRRCPAPP